MTITEPIMIVRIDVSMEHYRSIVEDVVYYRADLRMNQALRWKWYFEYIAARVKVKHPHRSVRLRIVRKPDDLKIGQQYIDEKTNSLLRAKRAQIKKLQNQQGTDLFDFAGEERRAKIEKLQSDIDALEKGEYNMWFPVEYKNHIKQWV